MKISFVSSCKSVICPCSEQSMSTVDWIVNEALGFVKTAAEYIRVLDVSHSSVLWPAFISPVFVLDLIKCVERITSSLLAISRSDHAHNHKIHLSDLSIDDTQISTKHVQDGATYGFSFYVQLFPSQPLEREVFYLRAPSLFKLI
jgi:hypothetical protein